MREFSTPPLVTDPQVGGLADAVFENAETDPDRPQLGRKTADGQWRDVTAAEFRDQVMALAKGLLTQGVRFGDRVAIMSRTRYEWTLFDFALWTIGAQPVPVYPSASAEQVAHILRETEAVGCVVEHEEHAMTLGSVIGRLPSLIRVWQLDSGAVDELTTTGAVLTDAVVQRHRLAVTPGSVATVIYTSGTTGHPRGCVLTHSNFMAECDNLIARWHPLFAPSDKDVQPSTLLFLPLSHVFGRMVEVAAIRARGRLGHQPEMTAEALLPDLATFQPTFLLAVPYIFEKVFTAARNKAQQEGNLAAFDKAVDVAVRVAEARERQAFGTGRGPSTALRLQHQLFDKLVYAKLRDALGGQVRNAVSGGSTMGRRLGLFYEGAGVTIYEGYGLTESTAAVTANPPGRVRFGTVGRPVPGTTVRLTRDGEILLHGQTIFSGYLNDPDDTEQTLRNGWLITGDLGILDEDGYLTITGRTKDVIVTASGKSLSPAPLENRIREHPLVEHCLVIGNDRPYVTALITLDQDALRHWLTLRHQPTDNPHDAATDPDLETEIRRVVSAANALVSKSESIRAYRILPTPFTEAEGLITPSRKPRRGRIEQLYAQTIEAMYRL